jgi:hypothetical protein
MCALMCKGTQWNSEFIVRSCMPWKQVVVKER